MAGRFWILEDGDRKIGTLRRTEDGATITMLGEEYSFDDFDQACSTLGIDIPGSIEEETPVEEVMGYPTNTPAFNSTWDVQRKLPLFTKSEKSKSFHAAGYYIIRFDHAWVRSFCPRANTLSAYRYQGPFKTRLEMNERLRLASD